MEEFTASQDAAIAAATEHFIEVSDGVKLWYRLWGNPDGIPVLFVHGGPGNCVADYENVNKKFFDASLYHVVEVDQRGTGYSTPSVRDPDIAMSVKNMALYADISIQMMSEDFEKVRSQLGVPSWLVFGGSWGSTLALDYAERYPKVCLGLIIRGIFLGTVAELEGFFCRKVFEGHAKQLADFDIFFEVVRDEAERSGEPPLDPNNGKRIVELYERMILRGDRDAIWRWHALETNLMEEDVEELFDPHKIGFSATGKALDGEFLVAQSVAFFEARLFVRLAYEDPVDLVDRAKLLLQEDGTPVPTWVVQGEADLVCPQVYAQNLVAAMEAAGVAPKSFFIQAGHRSTGDLMGTYLKKCVDEFTAMHGKL